MFRPMTSSEKQNRVRKVVECNSSKREVNLVSSSSGIGLSSQQTSKTYTFDKVRLFHTHCYLRMYTYSLHLANDDLSLF